MCKRLPGVVVDSAATVPTLIYTRALVAQDYFSKLDKGYTMCIHEADQEMVARFDKLHADGEPRAWLCVRIE